MNLLLICVLAAQIQIKPLLELDGETSEPSLAPDGKTLIFDWCTPDYKCGIYTRPFSGGDVHLLVGEDKKGGLTGHPRWSPDGKRIAFGRFYSHYDSHLFVRDSSSGVERDLGKTCLGQVTWNPNGRFLVASVDDEDSGCRPTLFSAATGTRVRRMASSGTESAFSPDGRMLAYADGKSLMLLRLTNDYRPMNPPVTIAREPREITGLSWAPDGKQIIYQCWGDVPYLRRIALTPGAQPQEIPGLTSELSISQILADGSALATETTEAQTLWRADLGSMPPKIEIVTHSECSSGAPGCSSDGRLRVFITTRTGLSEIWLADGDGANERPLVRSIPEFVNPKDDGVPNLVGWSPDGRWIAFTVFPAHGNADVRSYLYVVPSSGGIPRRLAKEAYGLYAPTWSRDSNSLYGSQGWPVEDRPHGLKSRLVRVDVADGKLTPLGVDGTWPRMSADGKFLYFFTSPYSKLSRKQIDGGVEERLRDKEDLLWFCYAVGARYLYLFQQPPRDATHQIHKIIRFDPETRKAITLAEISFQPRSAFLSPDDRFLYVEQREPSKQRVVLVHGLF